MADTEIVSKLGFNVSDALTALDSFNNKASETEARLGSLAAAFQKLNSSANLDALKAIKTGLGEATTAANGLAGAFQYMGTMVASRLMSKAIFEIASGLKDGTEQAMRLSTEIAKMQRIAPAGAGGAAGINDAIMKASSEKNLTLKESSAGYNEALRSGFQTSGEQTQVFDASINLAKSTMSELAPAVDLVAGSLKAYGMSANQADMMSSKLMAISDQSKISLENLNGVFGRSALMAGQLGVSIDELGAMHIALAQHMLKPSDAGQTIYQTLKSLVSPTKQMTASLNELGFSSVEQGVATLGLTGLLQALAQRTDGTVESFMQLSKAGKGVPGVMALGKISIEDVIKAEEKLSQTMASSAAQGANDVLNSDGQVLAKGLQQINNEFVTMQGGAVKWLADWVRSNEVVHDLSSTVDGLVKGLETAAVALPAIFAANWLAGLGNVSEAAGKLMTMLSSPIGVGGMVAVVAVAGAAAFAAADMINKSAHAESEAYEKANQEILNGFKDRVSKEEAILTQQNQQKIQDVSMAARGADKMYQVEVEAAQRGAAATESIVEKHLEKLIAGRQSYVDAMVKEQERGEKEIIASEDRIASAKERKSTLQLEAGMEGRAPEAQAQMLLGAAEKKLRDAQRNMDEATRTGDEHALKRAEKDYSAAEALASRAVSKGQAAKNDETVQAGYSEGVRIANDQIKAEEALEQAEKKRVSAIKAQTTAQQEQADAYKEMVKEYGKLTKTTDSAGKPLSAATMADNAKARAALMPKIEEASQFSQRDVQFAKKTGLTDALERAQRQMEENLPTAGSLTKRYQGIEVGFNYEKTINDARQKFEIASQNWVLRMKGIVDLSALENQAEKATHRAEPITNPTERVAAQNAVANYSGKLKTQTDEIRTQNAEVTGLIGAVKTLEKETESWTRPNKYVTSPFGDAKRATIQDIDEMIAAAEKGVKITDEQLSKFKEHYTQAYQASGTGASWYQRLNPLNSGALLDVESLGTAGMKLKDIQGKQQGEGGSFNMSTEALQDLDNKQKAAQAVLEGKSAAEQTLPAFKALETSSGQTAENLMRAVDALNKMGSNNRELEGAAGLTPPVARASGGMIFAADGYRNRGTDTVPAMLSPGEMVMSAQTVRHFGATLHAMNSGNRNVQGHSHGGSVTNVGDIHVAISGQHGVGPGTGRQIASELRRELRRGSASL